MSSDHPSVANMMRGRGTAHCTMTQKIHNKINIVKNVTEGPTSGLIEQARVVKSYAINFPINCKVLS